jgi:hypothetical protein
LKARELDEGLHEGVLKYVVGGVRRPHDVHQRVVQPILVSGDQLAERRSIALQGFVNQLSVVFHNRS